MLRSLAFVLAAAALTGCASISVKSEPPGARVVWSPDGSAPWRDWPPRAFDAKAAGKPALTPLHKWGRYGDAIFVTVEKDGYRRPLPQAVQLYTFKGNSLKFHLEELPESLAARMAAQGKVLYEGEWVVPADHGLAVYEGEVMKAEEANRREMAAKGLVEWEGKWVAPEERQRLFASAESAAGKVELKGRWVNPETARQEQEWDAQVLAIHDNGSYLELPLPRTLGKSDTGLAQVQVLNNSGTPSTIIFSGPSSFKFQLGPYQSWGIKSGESLYLVDGLYSVAVIPAAGGDVAPASSATRAREDGGAAMAQLGSARLAPGFRYSFSVSGGAALTPESLSSYAPPQTTLPIKLEDIAVPDIDKIKEDAAPPKAPEGAGDRAPGAAGGNRGGNRPGGPGGRPGGGGPRPGGGGGRPRG